MVQVLSAIFFHIIPSLNQFLELTEGSLPCLIDQDKVRQHSKGLDQRNDVELEGHHLAETNLTSLHEVKARPQNQDRTQPQHEAIHGHVKGTIAGNIVPASGQGRCFLGKTTRQLVLLAISPNHSDAFHRLQDLIAELRNGIPSLIHLGFQGLRHLVGPEGHDDNRNHPHQRNLPRNQKHNRNHKGNHTTRIKDNHEPIAHHILEHFHIR